MDILDTIKTNADLRALPEEDIPRLCEQIRTFLVENVAKTGGHLASSLGAVELTVALHRVYDPERDRILFDVGHQAYVHKLLTGRKNRFPTLRQYGGLSGFPKPEESPADPFVAGHASDSVSVAMGMARARTLRGEDYDVVAVVGDGSMTGGLCFEGLSDAGESELAYKMITRPEFPSYGALIGFGETTIPECFDLPGEGNYSHNHHMYCDIKSWFISAVAGIRYNPDGRDHARVLIKPAFIPSLTFAEADYDSPAGKISVRWERTRTGVELTVRAAEGICADVVMPDGTSVAHSGERVYKF